MIPENEIYFQLVRSIEPNIKEKHNFLKETNVEAAKQFFMLSNAFRRPLLFLRSFGNNPFIFTKVKYEDTQEIYYRFDFKWISWLTLYSLISQILYSSGFGLLTYRIFHGDYHSATIPGLELKNQHITPISEGLMKAFLTTFILASAGGCSVSFWTSSRLCKFLNNWKDFVLHFSRSFPERAADFGKVEYYSRAVLRFAVGLSTIYLIWAPFLYKNCLFGFKHCTSLEKEQSFMFVSYGCTSIINMTFEHYKMAVMMSTLIQGFSQIKMAVSESKQVLSMTKNESSLRNVFRTVYFLRRQTVLLSQIVGPTQLFLLLFLFALIIIIWMMAIQLATADFPQSLLFVVFSVGILQFTRFFLFAVFTEKILNEEREVVAEVLQIKTQTLRAQIERQIFIDLVSGRPSEFAFGHVITFKRTLFLALMTNSTTYLIAILQLAEAKTGEITQPSTPPLSSDLYNMTIPV